MAQDFLKGVTEQPGGSLIPRDDAALLVGDDDRIGRRIDQGAEAFFAVSACSAYSAFAASLDADGALKDCLRSSSRL
ncbi:MAG: hypothetical protein U0361_12870 [Nitrospiraceae bacterium]